MMRYKPSSFEVDEQYVPITDVEAFALDYLLFLYKRKSLSRERSRAIRQILLHVLENKIEIFLKKNEDAESGDEASEPEETISPPSSDDDYSDSDIEVDTDDEEDVGEMEVDSGSSEAPLTLEQLPSHSADFRVEQLFEKYKDAKFSVKRLRKELKSYTHLINRVGSNFEGNRFKTFHVSVQGKRNYMEDQVRVMEYPGELLGSQSLESVSYFGVYDGHGGACAAKYVLRRLHSRVMEHKEFPKNDSPELVECITSILSEAMINIDGEFNDLSESRGWKSGTTAIVSLIYGNTLVSACVGDSKSVLYKGGEATVMNKPHSPGAPEEKERIEKIGGVVVYFAGAWRVNGVIGVSRSLGDPPFRTLLIPDPDTQSYTLEGADYMVMATDGLWDVVKEAEVPELLKNARIRGVKREKILAAIERKKKEKRGEVVEKEYVVHEPLVDFAKVLTKEALKRGSRDNISVVFVQFAPFPPLHASAGSESSASSEFKEDAAD